MTAVPGLPPIWPRRRRAAGFARGSASGGAVSIPVTARDRLDLRQKLLDRVRLLPGVTAHAGLLSASPADVRISLEEAIANGPPESRLGSRDLAEITAGGDVLLRLPPDTRDDLRRAGWVRDCGAWLRVPFARRAAEAEIIWRILLCAYEFATGPAPAVHNAVASHRPATLYSAPAETGAAI